MPVAIEKPAAQLRRADTDGRQDVLRRAGLHADQRDGEVLDADVAAMRRERFMCRELQASLGPGSEGNLIARRAADGSTTPPQPAGCRWPRPEGGRPEGRLRLAADGVEIDADGGQRTPVESVEHGGRAGPPESDHADQFFLEADTDVFGNKTYTYGTTQRANDGKLIYTIAGSADAGEFNPADNTVSVQVSVAKLNAILAAAKHPAIGDGTVVAGLRSRSYTIEVVPPVNGQASRQGRRDIARGGTQFVIHDSTSPAVAPPPTPTP